MDQDFEGAIDEVRIYDYALVPDEILLDMAGCTPSAIEGGIEISPVSYDFGEVYPGESTAYREFTIINRGSESHIVSSLYLDGDDRRDFVVLNNTCSMLTIGPSESCTIDIAFSPRSTGQKSVSLFYVVAGVMKDTSDGLDDPYIQQLFVTDGSVTVEWTIQIDESDSQDITSIVETGDGDFIVAGNTSTDAESSDIFLAKIDPERSTVEEQILWTKIITNEKGATSTSTISPTSDKGYILSGSLNYSDTDNDLYLLKIDSDGNKLWDQTFGSSRIESANAAQETADGGIVIGGDIFPADADYKNIYIVKTDSLGNMVWDKEIVEAGNSSVHFIEQTKDKGYIFCGDHQDPKGDAMSFIEKLDDDSALPKFSLSDDSINFGDVNSGTTENRVVTLTNDGTVDLIIDSLEITGDNSSWFLIESISPRCSGDKDNPLPAGDSCTFTINFSPTDGPINDASLSIKTNYIGTSDTIALNGRGTGAGEFTLTLNMDGGDGTGIVSNSFTGGECTGSDPCTDSIPSYTTLTLTATPDMGSFFDGWSMEGCAFITIDNECVIDMTEDIAVTATFTKDLVTASDIAPEIYINGYAADFDILIKKDRALEIAVTLDLGSAEGEFGELWIMYEGPFGWYSFDMEYEEIAEEWSGFWYNDYYPSWQGNLIPIETPYTVLSNAADGTHPDGLDVGVYTFYFIVDLIMNGMMDDDGEEGIFFTDSITIDVVN